jgi:trimeric autotransporter adhesin
MHNRALSSLANAISILVLSTLARAQDVDVPGNLTMVDSTATEGNVLKAGYPFLHNFGVANTFVGSGAGNLVMSGGYNAATGTLALASNADGSYNTATGYVALFNNTSGEVNTATGCNALHSNTVGTDNTATGFNALYSNTVGLFNTSSGVGSLRNSIDGSSNTASGYRALFSNISGSNNTAVGFQADVASANLTNATAIGSDAVVDASNKIRLGNANVEVIEGQVGFTASSDRNQKENFKDVDAEEVLTKIRGLNVTSWNLIGQDPNRFRHYGPVAQDFFAAFGHDGVGTIGTPTTITSTDMDGILIAAAQALEKRTVEQERRAVKQTRAINVLRKEAHALRAENADLKARLAALERRFASSALSKSE